MRKSSFLILLSFLLVVISILPIYGQTSEFNNDQRKVKNIIFLIGDGMGLSHVQAAMTKSPTVLNIEKLPIIGLQKTNSANNYVTCSAASATALASGEKTNNGVVGLNVNGEKTESILHVVKNQGLKTGIVVTNTITHATPAGFIAHQPDRNLYEEIALDILASDVDVLIGGGRDHFTMREDNRNLELEMKSKGYFITSDIKEIKEIHKKVLALVGPSHLTSVMDGKTPDEFYTKDDELGNGEKDIVVSESRGDFLPNAVKKAIDVLNYNNQNGFFLLVEGSQIDPASHAHDLDRTIAEMIDFDQAVGIAIDFAKADGNTLVVVTGDHETGGLTVLRGNTETGEVRGHFSTPGHTGIMLPVFSMGSGSDNFSGFFDNTEFKQKFLDSYSFSVN